MGSATWQLQLEGIFFYFKSCSVKSGDDAVPIIQDSCLSEGLGVKMSSEELTSFTYRSFQFDGADSKDQEIQCSLKLCQGQDCGQTNMKAATCANEAPFFYKQL